MTTTVVTSHSAQLRGTTLEAGSDLSKLPARPRQANWRTTPPEIAVDITKLFIAENERQDREGYEFDSLLPSWPDVKWDPLQYHHYEDRGLDADPGYKDLFAAATKIEHLTPLFGTVLYGVSLADLNEAQRDQLARLVAFRGVAFFRKQEELDIHKQLELGRHFGELHRHATTAIPKAAAQDPELLDVHVVYSNERRVPNFGVSQLKLWHSDVSYEKQPPSVTSLKVLSGPDVGGDTLWTSGYGLYDALSPELQTYLTEKTATHSGVEQAAGSQKAGNTVRRDPLVTEHPIIRVNPVTGWRAVYVNPGFTRSIVGVPDVESKAILQLLYDTQATNVNTTVRWSWQPNDVAVWDNRVTMHSASFGFYPARRHGVRVASHAEVPYFDSNSGSQQEAVLAANNLAPAHKDGANPPVFSD